MQYINLNKTLELENKIEDLLLISIDDQIETINDKDGIKIKGEILISGNVRLIEGEKDFKDILEIDIFLNEEEITDRNSLNVTINDFNYNIEENKLLLNISMKIEGLKQIETIFPSEENNEFIQKEEIENIEDNEKELKNMEIEMEEDKKVYIDVDINLNDRKEIIQNEIEEKNKEEILDKIEEVERMEEKIDEEIIIEEKKKSLLKSVFASKRINEEVSWKIHCVKNETSYEEIANKYGVDINKLISINNNEKIVEGKLVFLPLE